MIQSVIGLKRKVNYLVINDYRCFFYQVCEAYLSPLFSFSPFLPVRSNLRKTEEETKGWFWPPNNFFLGK